MQNKRSIFAVVRNGKIDKYLFEGGYAQASVAGSTTDNFSFFYYNRDHLGSIREVVDANGNIRQVTNYYPFGTPYADSPVNPDHQPYKYNGKELDRMHGLDTYDYGARQHDPILARWDRMDPLCEKYYGISPYVYCADNPVKYIDEHGDSLSLSGSEDDVNLTLRVYNQGLGGYYSVNADNNGILSLSAVEGKDEREMSSSQKAIYDVLNRVINGKGMATIKIENGTNILIGDINSFTIDIGDINAIGTGSDISSISVLAHETYEEYLVQTSMKGKTESIINAHEKASGVERLITGSYLDPLDRSISNGKMRISVLGPNNDIKKTVYIHIDKSNNVIGVTR